MSAPDGTTSSTDLSFIVRMDFHVLDHDAVIASAVSAQLAAEPDLTEAEAALEVGDEIEDALFVIANTLGLDALVETTNGLEVRAVVSEVAYGLEEIVLEEDED